MIMLAGIETRFGGKLSKKSYAGRTERAREIADIPSFPKEKLMLFIKIILQCIDISVWHN